MQTSSTRGYGRYEFPCRVSVASPLPETIEIRLQAEPATPQGYTILGTLRKDTEIGGFAYATEDDWRESPHVAFANLRIEDPRSVEAYLRRNGIMLAWFRTNDLQATFEVADWELKLAQQILRDAWEGKNSSIVALEAEVEENTKADVVPSWGFVQLRVNNLWTFIAFLFLMDSKAGKPGVCANPNCPAPYFRKKRSTQKFCEAGPCVAYAQRQYALRWWNLEGKKRRDQKATDNKSLGRKSRELRRNQSAAGKR